MNNQIYNWPSGLKKTLSRKYILSILEKADKPLSAMEIHNEMKRLGRSVWLSTIYRTLDLFEEHKIVIKNPVMSDEVAVYVLNNHKHEHYAVCMNCEKLFPLDNCPMDQFNPDIKDEDFQIINHKLEIYGYCSQCK